MLLLYIIKPDVVYDHKYNQFRQFGTTNGKTLLPIYVIGILLSIILYVFFHNLATSNKSSDNLLNHSLNHSMNHSSDNKITQSMLQTENLSSLDQYKYYMQQNQIQQLQNQIQQIVQQQLLQQQIVQTKSSINPNRTKSILPNSLSI
jgi:lipopolysaccharide export LptBFGC system permease protein LptF